MHATKPQESCAVPGGHTATHKWRLVSWRCRAPKHPRLELVQAGLQQVVGGRAQRKGGNVIVLLRREAAGMCGRSKKGRESG